MIYKSCIIGLLLSAVALHAEAVELNKEGRDPAYVESIVNRSKKIVDKLGISDQKKADDVTTIIANRYFKLNDIYTARDAKVKSAKETLTGDAKNEAVQAAQNEKDAALYRSHFEFPADLSLYLTPEQIDAVKDGMTYGVVKVTYDSHLDMIPTLTDEEKAQIMAWLIEARELAMDAEKSCIIGLLLSAVALHAEAVELNKEGRDPAYVESIVNRSKKIVDKLGISDQKKADDVTTIIANRYFKLNDIYTARDAKVKSAKETLTGDAKNEAVQAAQNEKDAALYRSHFEFPADLSLYLTPEQIDAVKDGMTYGVVKVTYDSHLDMIPTLTDEEKAQIMAWLIEARELAMDAETSNKKHEVFGKYKGRINNYLAKRGYDLKKEREAWYERIKARGGTI
ncbi:DUF3826 domain-containing protein [uncultured Duncaniella sp.]|uniref:DUF3826 domain-containing protein n=5 Tax=uncultured Duncaniella sp. TaxID=2768039 RepID=UPI0025B469FE|nr:DUF3826 domain-containing protein [uncultured Duncaniella sp.]